MKTKKEDVIFKESALKNVAKNKRKISKPKAGTSLEKTIKNIEKIFKKKKAEVKAAKKKEINSIKSKFKPKSKSKSNFKIKSKNLKDKGIIYVGHIPHGFYEEEMKDYFKQFGNVTQIRVARSRRTGKSCGYGYVEFLDSEVAKIAANTMNNYLMCGRLLKAVYIPPEKQHFGFFAGINWSEDNYPKLKNRKKVILNRNRFQSAEKHQKYVQRSLSKLSALENKLQDKGISIKFQPVDISNSNECLNI